MSFVRVPGNDVPAGAEEHWLEGRGGVRLRALTAPASAAPPRGAVIICTGRTEFIEKYFEVVGELQARGFCVFIMDWRGQGLSGRQLANPMKGHFETLDDPVNDLATALKVLADRLPRPHVLLAHSMGGAIALRALQTRRVEVEAAAFSAPMWGIANLGAFGKKFARFATAIGGGGAFAPGVEKRWRRESFKRNSVTHDKERHARAQGLIAEEPRLALAGPTLGWVTAAADACEAFLQPRALAHLRIPILVASAAQEALVDNRSHADVAALLPDCTHITIAGAKHELLMETDDIRAQFWAAFDALLARAMRPKAEA